MMELPIQKSKLESTYYRGRVKQMVSNYENLSNRLVPIFLKNPTSPVNLVYRNPPWSPSVNRNFSSNMIPISSHNSSVNESELVNQRPLPYTQVQKKLEVWSKNAEVPLAMGRNMPDIAQKMTPKFPSRPILLEKPDFCKRLLNCLPDGDNPNLVEKLHFSPVKAPISLNFLEAYKDESILSSFSVPNNETSTSCHSEIVHNETVGTDKMMEMISPPSHSEAKEVIGDVFNFLSVGRKDSPSTLPSHLSLKKSEQDLDFAQTRSSSSLSHSVSFYRVMQNRHRSESLSIPRSPSFRRSRLIQNVFTEADFNQKIEQLKLAIRIQNEQEKQAFKALSYCRYKLRHFKGYSEELNAHRVLLVANSRKNALINHMESIKKDWTINRTFASFDQTINRSVRITFEANLNPNFVNNRIGQENAYFVALAQCNEHVDATSVINVYGSHPRLKGSFELSKLPPDFYILITIYAMLMENIHSRSATLTEKAMHIFNSETGPKKQTLPKNSRFEEVGHAIVQKKDVGQKLLELNDLMYPMKDFITIEMATLTITDIVDIESKGFLTRYDTVADKGAWTRYWCTLCKGKMRFWSYPEDEEDKSPLMELDLNSIKECQLKMADKNDCARANTFVLNLYGRDKLLYLAADTKEQCSAWMTDIGQGAGWLQVDDK